MTPFQTLNPMMVQVPVFVPVAVPVAMPMPVPMVARRVPQQPPAQPKPPTAMETVAKVATVVGQLFDFAKKHLNAGTTAPAQNGRAAQQDYTAQPEMLPDSAFGEPEQLPQAWGGDWGTDVPMPELPAMPTWDMGGMMGGFDPNAMTGGFDPNMMAGGFDPNGGW